ncbi:Crp/Fnr family transcriptional regulator [Sphingomonas sp. HT-1]|jgi:CRP-like cAMP-binding protein|uniref:Crp/Fnr family transcriptional regulator n=1 Tax=unclassified Sphingomonas TaxID=196159 RepID=UPI000A3E71FA|nr:MULTISPECIES: Crp/Fnr family transcriptional regulator [unclassified Sphingomonas]
MLTRTLPATHTSVSRRLGSLAQLADQDRNLLRTAAEAPQTISAMRDLVVEGQRIGGQFLVLDGWLGRTRLFSDGRRQVLSFLLPGDLIPEPAHAEPIAATTITALSETLLCPAPAPPSAGLKEAYAISAALSETYLLRQIARLGRMSAYERILDWLYEMHERLSLAGLAGPDSFAMPLTQETLADALGLTSVHVNRTLQAMRRDGVLEWRGGAVRLMRGSREAVPSRSRAPAAGRLGSALSLAAR